MPRMDELALAQRLIAFDTSNAEGLRRAAEFVGGWLESNDIKADPDRVARAAGDDGRGRARPAAPTLVLHGHMDVVPGGRDQFEPTDRRRPAARPGRLRHEGRAGRDAGRAARPPRPGGRAPPPWDRLGRGIRGGGEPRLRRTGARAASSATSRSRASRPTSRSGVQAKGVLAMRLRGAGALGARRDAVARGQRRRQGGRGIQGYRVATVCTPQLRPVRPALHQSRSDHGRRRPEQSARYLRHRRRYPLPARSGSRRDPRAGERPARHPACSPPSGARPRWSSRTPLRGRASARRPRRTIPSG